MNKLLMTLMVCFLFSFQYTWAQDTIHLKRGKPLRVNIIKETLNECHYKVSGVVIKVEWKKIDRIDQKLLDQILAIGGSPELVLGFWQWNPSHAGTFVSLP